MAGRLYATQHGRDQLYENWPSLYKPAQGQNLPGEEIVILRLGADYGWPECYFDLIQNKLVLAPEYGGDGGKLVSALRADAGAPRLLPRPLGPERHGDLQRHAVSPSYRGGAFIAFHGSWNRAPGPQGGYKVVFLPLANGKLAGPAFAFANGFRRRLSPDPSRATFRPSGLAVGPDGALYISDDVHGRIWRVVYKGTGASASAPAPAFASVLDAGGQ